MNSWWIYWIWTITVFYINSREGWILVVGGVLELPFSPPQLSSSSLIILGLIKSELNYKCDKTAFTSEVNFVGSDFGHTILLKWTLLQNKLIFLLSKKKSATAYIYILLNLAGLWPSSMYCICNLSKSIAPPFFNRDATECPCVAFWWDQTPPKQKTQTSAVFDT